MGHRAQFVVVGPAGWRTFFSHWAANGIYRELAAGPNAALAFALAQQELTGTDDPWLDDVWAEGGFLLDVPARLLLWFGDDVMADLPTRRAFGRLLERTWRGWTVCWALDGLGDLVARLGLDRQLVRTGDDEDLDPARPLAPAVEPERWLGDGGAPGPVTRQGDVTLITARLDDGACRTWLVEEEPHAHPASRGPALLTDLMGLPEAWQAVGAEPDAGPDTGPDAGPDARRAPLRLTAVPLAGLHVDSGRREMSWWSAGWCPGLGQVLPDRWPGWSLTCWGDGYERQGAAAGDAVQLPAIDLTAALEALAPRLTAERPDPVATFTDAVQRHVDAGARVEVNPATREHVTVPPDPQQRAGLDEALRATLAELRAQGAAGPHGPGPTEAARQVPDHGTDHGTAEGDGR